jgi:hypothetical protein
MGSFTAGIPTGKSASFQHHEAAMDDREHPHPEAFMADARALGIATVVIAWQHEYGQQDGVEMVNYRLLQRLTLLAYHRPSAAILRCHLAGGGAEREALRRNLAANGFAVALRCRNQLGIPATG